MPVSDPNAAVFPQELQVGTLGDELGTHLRLGLRCWSTRCPAGTELACSARARNPRAQRAQNLLIQGHRPAHRSKGITQNH